MRKVIDLCLDMPDFEEDLIRTAMHFCLPEFKEAWGGYRENFNGGIEKKIGLTFREMDATLENEGREAFMKLITEAAHKNAPTLDSFVKEMDDLGVLWGMTCHNSHDNEKTARICRQYPDRLGGFCFVNPLDGMKAVREVEYAVKELGMKGVYITAFRTHLPANDKHNYPIYAKCVELDVPVFIYSSMNLSAAVPYDIGHPRYIDEVARDFPELKILASVSGWPWTLDFIGLALRHKNVYLNMETHNPALITVQGSGYEPYLHWMPRIQDKFFFSSDWNSQGKTLESLIKSVEEWPFSDEIKEKVLYKNAAKFFGIEV
ncbi:MAG: amidohydrolase [Oscillospiraceae bacterium]|nr:amidohydrolase [Oscillospiraceae bacterium]